MKIPQKEVVDERVNALVPEVRATDDPGSEGQLITVFAVVGADVGLLVGKAVGFN